LISTRMRGTYFVRSAGLAVALLLGTGLVMAQQVKSVLAKAATMDEAARRSQTRVDDVVDKTRVIVRQYSALTKEIEGLNVYNTLLQKQIENQAQEMADLESSIEQVSVIERQVVPLMAQMVKSLGQFVELDLPFLLKERRKRVTFLETLLERSDVTVAEKLRRVLEAYEIENDYGRTIETYKDSLELDGASREVDFLRIGRIALLYQSVDGKVYGMWDREKKAWVSLPAQYRNQIREGIKIARKQVAPNLLLLPISAPENTQ
jgi:hypothetical protein